MLLQIRYRHIAFNHYHTDLVICHQSNLKAYWAGPKFAIDYFAPPFLGTTIGFFKNLNYHSQQKRKNLYTSDSNLIQLIDADFDLEKEALLKSLILKIIKANLPYHLWKSNCNSAAFEILRAIYPSHPPTPFEYLSVPGWDVNPFDYVPVTQPDSQTFPQPSSDFVPLWYFTNFL
ncbi:hypothetical protein [Chroococcus sp. FPU101]|uniref:hypothetical protein n=1 Tax=Chroococcus sp. FPU101 TaxID=1974212 RepID=UPI001A8EC5EF|nr:hypothetical protein [Chroococcus sp. FPU101]GFE71853.1 hypothetical protein CFPU101_44630 [Chroococcus sp. FPU101]